MSLPPGPSQTPTEQNFHWFSRPYAYLNECEAELGDVFTLHFQGLGPHVFFSRPLWIKQIFSGDASQLLGGEGKEMLRPFLGDTSLLLTDGDLYQKHRKTLLPFFRTPFLDAWEERLPKQIAAAFERLPPEFPVHDFYLDISLRLILDAVIGPSDRVDEFAKVTLDFMHAVSFNPLGAGLENSKAVERLNQNRARMDEMVYGEIRRQKANPGPGSPSSILAALLADESVKEWSETEIRDEVLTLLIAGHETTASSLAWVTFELAQHPDVVKRVSGAVRAGKADARAQVSAVLKEGMRLWPVIPIVARKLKSSYRLGEWEFPAGVHLVPCLYLAHRRSDLFPEPNTFKPERFLESTPSPFEFFPFGGGVRRCLGMGMATTEMEEVLFQLLRDYDLAFTGYDKVRPSRRSVAIIPSGPFRMERKKRL